MKTVLVAALLGLSIGAIAQDRDHDHDRNEHRYQDNRNYQAHDNVPGRVYNSFHRDHPNAGEAEWGHNGRDWHAHYRDQQYGRDAYANYDRRGRHIDTHVAWDRDHMPRGFDDRIYDRYHTRDYRIYRIERPGGGFIYQLMLNLLGGPQVVYVDEYGNVINYDDDHYYYGY